MIFFGTSEVGWIGQKDVSDWDAGMQQHFHVKGRKNKKFVISLEQVSLHVGRKGNCDQFALDKIVYEPRCLWGLSMAVAP